MNHAEKCLWKCFHLIWMIEKKLIRTHNFTLFATIELNVFIFFYGRRYSWSQPKANTRRKNSDAEIWKLTDSNRICNWVLFSQHSKMNTKKKNTLNNCGMVSCQLCWRHKHKLNNVPNDCVDFDGNETRNVDYGAVTSMYRYLAWMTYQYNDSLTQRPTQVDVIVFNNRI